MVEGFFSIPESDILSDVQKDRILKKLQNKLEKDGILHVRSQVYRSQLSNKLEVANKINDIIFKALQLEKPRIATKPSKAAIARRIENKKRISEKKAWRRISGF